MIEGDGFVFGVFGLCICIYFSLCNGYFVIENISFCVFYVCVLHVYYIGYEVCV